MEQSRSSNIATTPTGFAFGSGPVARIDAGDALDREHKTQRTRAFQPSFEQREPRLRASKELRDLAQLQLATRSPSPQTITR